MSRARPLIVFLLLVGAFIVVWVSAHPIMGGPGLTWDEAYYYPTFVDVKEWTGLLVTDPGAALSREGIHVGWHRINELPPVVKWLGALSLTIVPDAGWYRLGALRMVPALAFVLTLVLMYNVACRWRGRLCGILAVSLYVLHPRLYAHAQIAATETVFTCVTMLTIWICLHDLSRWRWRIALVAALALALATKVNGIVLASAIVAWLLARRAARQPLRPAHWRPAGVDLATLALLLIAPVLALAIWPWMWHDTAGRIGGYIHFIREHSHQGLWYLGKKWNFTGELAPVTYPIVIAHLTAPIAWLVVVWAGLLTTLVVAVRRRKLPAQPLLLALCAAAPLAASSLPSSPKYDGIRLFLPMFAPLVLLASGGVVTLLTTSRRRWALAPHHGLILLPLLLMQIQAIYLRPTLSYYNPLVGWIWGSEGVFPFEQTYWGDAMRRDVVFQLDRKLPPNAKVKTLAMQTETFTILQEWGLLRADLRFNEPPPYDAHLLQNRRGFWANAEWTIWQSRDPLATWGRGSNNEPLIYLYDGRPPGF